MPPSDSSSSPTGSAGRFAPSPTGRLHVGNLRTALIAWLYSKSAGSDFYLRFEDLDTNAVRAEHYETQRSDLVALGLHWDGEPLIQSERLDLYQDAVATLRNNAETYDCYCSRKDIREAAQAPNGGIATQGRYPGTCRQLTKAQRQDRIDDGRPAAIRLVGSETDTTVTDELCGEVTGNYSDVVIVRNDGTPAYNLVVVVDDHAQGVELVVRADDLLDSTPAHVGLAQKLGLSVPRYAHVPLMTGEDNFRLAKRDGAVTLADRIELGETPAVVLGFLAHSAGLADTPEPIASAADLLNSFDPLKIGRQAFQLSSAYRNSSPTV